VGKHVMMVGAWAAGVVGGFVKLGWETVLPARTPDRPSPPVVLLDKLGLPADGWTYSFSGHTMNLGGLAVHFAFSMVFAAVYFSLVARFPVAGAWHGAAFGLLVWIGAHLVVMPLLGVTPPAAALPLDENLSEAMGHVVWLWVIDAFRPRGGARRSPA
jgi:putative membrane protein